MILILKKWLGYLYDSKLILRITISHHGTQITKSHQELIKLFLDIVMSGYVQLTLLISISVIGVMLSGYNFSPLLVHKGLLL